MSELTESQKARWSTLVQNRGNLTDAERLDYLKRSLTGEAERTINALQPSDENYPVA